MADKIPCTADRLRKNHTPSPLEGLKPNTISTTFGAAKARALIQTILRNLRSAEFSCFWMGKLISSCFIRKPAAFDAAAKKSDTRPFEAGCRRLGVVAHQPTAERLQESGDRRDRQNRQSSECNAP